MYLRRHCYDKPHRCPGRAGGGWRYPYLTERPGWWDDEHDGPWERDTRTRRTHWWQRKHRCDTGHLYALAYPDPWRLWRWHRCNECDVLTLPIVVRYLDPSWYRHAYRFHRSSDWWWALTHHRQQWMDPSTAPWWSAPYALWQSVRRAVRSVRWRIPYRAGILWCWYAPRHRAARDAAIAKVKQDYGVK